jgi:hypothetical protein
MVSLATVSVIQFAKRRLIIPLGNIELDKIKKETIVVLPQNLPGEAEEENEEYLSV